MNVNKTNELQLDQVVSKEVLILLHSPEAYECLPGRVSQMMRM